MGPSAVADGENYTCERRVRNTMMLQWGRRR